ncbi:MAG TPA: ACT domain-containing protein [Ktedonobacterales bacterium]
MTDATFTLTLLPEQYAICRLAPDAPVPAWVPSSGEFVSLSRTRNELSIVCNQASLPVDIAAAQVGRGRRCLRIEGPFDLSVVGVLATISAALAEADIAIFVVSTYDTDYVLLREADLDAAIRALTARGHPVVS